MIYEYTYSKTWTLLAMIVDATDTRHRTRR